MASKKLVSSQMASGSEMAVWASAVPVGVSRRPIPVMIATRGMPIATGGTIRVTRVANMNTRPLRVAKRVMA
jgi:predicted permease